MPRGSFMRTIAAVFWPKSMTWIPGAGWLMFLAGRALTFWIGGISCGTSLVVLGIAVLNTTGVHVTAAVALPLLALLLLAPVRVAL